MVGAAIVVSVAVALFALAVMLAAFTGSRFPIWIPFSSWAKRKMKVMTSLKYWKSKMYLRNSLA